MKLTPWFPPAIKPVRVGVYEVQCRSDTGLLWPWDSYAYWDGTTWGFATSHKWSAKKNHKINGKTSRSQEKTWRGLTECARAKGEENG